MVMKCFLSMILFMLFIRSWGQKEPKDTLYFSFKPNYMLVERNYEGVHTFIFKSEELVTSAFGQIVEEDLFFFTQSSFPTKKNSLKPKRIYNLKKFLKRKKEQFGDNSTGKLDA